MLAPVVLSLFAVFAIQAPRASETTKKHVQETDSTFALAAIWDSAVAEVLVYSVRSGAVSGNPAGEVREGGPGDRIGGSGYLITERRFFPPDGAAEIKPAGRDGIEILNAVMTSSWMESGMPYSRNVAAKLPRRGPFLLLRQDESLQSPAGASHRSLDCRVTPPRLRILAGGMEAAADSTLEHWPLYTEEMLFTYVRALPKRAGYRQEIWLLDGGLRGKVPPRIRFATLSVRGKMAGIREVDTWHVTLDREGGGRSEFWMSQSGLHPVVLAILTDGSEWALREISRKKSPSR